MRLQMRTRKREWQQPEDIDAAPISRSESEVTRAGVVLTVGGETIELCPREARHLASIMLNAAIAAEQ